MAVSTFSHEGNSIDYTPTVAIAAGDVILQGDLIGVAAIDIAANELGALAVEGVFDFAKATTGGSAFTAGQLAYWDAAAKQATITATANKLIGKAVAATTDADALVRVKMTP